MQQGAPDQSHRVGSGWISGLYCVRCHHHFAPEYHQKVTGYEVRVEADQTERPPQVFTAVDSSRRYRLRNRSGGHQEAIRLSEDKYCSVGAMVQERQLPYHMRLSKTKPRG